jgi:hypothetical protein
LIITIHGSSGKYFYLESVGIIFLAILSFVGLLNYKRRFGERVLLYVYIFYLTNLCLLWWFVKDLHLVLLLLSLLGFILALPSLKELQSSGSRNFRDSHRNSQKGAFPLHHPLQASPAYTDYASHKVETYSEPHSQVFEEHSEDDESEENIRFVQKLKSYSSNLKDNGTKINPGKINQGKLTNSEDPSFSGKTKAAFKPGKYVASQRSNIYHEPKCDWAKKIHPSRRVWFASKEDAWEKGYKSHECVN